MMELGRRARRTAWRLGRKLYCTARGEGANDIAINGESYVQGCVLKAAQSSEPINVFDVGANLGAWTKSLVDQIGPGQPGAVKIWAFEPSPESFANLSARFLLNNNVCCIPKALSSNSGSDRLMIVSATGGTNTLEFDGALESRSCGVIEIQKTTAAQFCEEFGIEHIHLLKCDAEGHDFSVIDGAALMLAAGRIDVLQFEYNHRWIYSRTFLKDVFDLVSGMSYSVAAVRSSRIELLPEWHPELDRFFEANYLIVHQRALPWFDVYQGHFDHANTYA